MTIIKLRNNTPEPGTVQRLTRLHFVLGDVLATLRWGVCHPGYTTWNESEEVALLVLDIEASEWHPWVALNVYGETYCWQDEIQAYSSGEKAFRILEVIIGLDAP